MPCHVLVAFQGRYIHASRPGKNCMHTSTDTSQKASHGGTAMWLWELMKMGTCEDTTKALWPGHTREGTQVAMTSPPASLELDAHRRERQLALEATAAAAAPVADGLIDTEYSRGQRQVPRRSSKVPRRAFPQKKAKNFDGRATRRATHADPKWPATMSTRRPWAPGTPLRRCCTCFRRAPGQGPGDSSGYGWPRPRRNWASTRSPTRPSTR